jgi:hypothetical protein
MKPGTMTRSTLNPPASSRIARFWSAYFVVARRGKAPLLAPPQHGGRAIADARRPRLQELVDWL